MKLPTPVYYFYKYSFILEPFIVYSSTLTQSIVFIDEDPPYTLYYWSNRII
jgi:hypothetical protein